MISGRKFDKAIKVIGREYMNFYNDEQLKHEIALRDYKIKNVNCKSNTLSVIDLLEIHKNYLSNYGNGFVKICIDNLRIFKCPALTKDQVERLAMVFDSSMFSIMVDTRTQTFNIHDEFHFNNFNEGDLYTYIEFTARNIGGKFYVEIEKFNQSPSDVLSEWKLNILLDITKYIITFTLGALLGYLFK